MDLTFKQFLLEGGEQAERQERGLIQTIKSLVKATRKPVMIQGIPKPIIDAFKKEKSEHGKEPYTDVVLVTSDKKQINISCKGPSAPSLAGGGLAGMMKILEEDPTFIHNVYDSIIAGYDNLGLQDGKVYPAEKVPDLSLAIPEELKLTLVKGTKAMGGPIHYMYIGPMDVKFDKNTNSFNGEFISVKNYAKGDLYLRVRKRDLTKSAYPGIRPKIKYTPNLINKRTNLPVVLTVATDLPEIKGKNALRLVIYNKPIGVTVPLKFDK